MVEAKQTSKHSRVAPPTTLFKFCYIMRGLPGSGKSTVAYQLAGATGVVLNLDSKVNRQTRTSGGSGEAGGEADSLFDIHEKHYAEFKAEVLKGTPVIVVDNSNIKESEYIHFMQFAMKEHYIASVVTLPAPADLEEAARRSSQGVTVSELSSMMSMYEPASLSMLSRKSSDLQDARERGLGALRLSPRREANLGNVSRRSSSHYREVPTNTIMEHARDREEEQEESDE